MPFFQRQTLLTKAGFSQAEMLSVTDMAQRRRADNTAPRVLTMSLCAAHHFCLFVHAVLIFFERSMWK